MPNLTKYLLKLATDAKELAKYRDLYVNHPSDLVTYLQTSAVGLREDQAQLLAQHDSYGVVVAVHEELNDESSDPDNAFYGTPIVFTAPVNNYVQLPTSTSSK